MSGIDSGNTAFVLISAFLVFIMTLGIGSFYGGMVRRKNVGNTMLMCTSVAGLVSVLWIAIGYSLAFGSGFSVADATGAEVANPILGGLDKRSWAASASTPSTATSPSLCSCSSRGCSPS